MAVPKKKRSVSRKGMVSAGQHHKLYPKFPMACPNCGDLTLPLRACPSCGTYKGKEVFKVKSKDEVASEDNSEN